jgi:hypothetical protein
MTVSDAVHDTAASILTRKKHVRSLWKVFASRALVWGAQLAESRYSQTWQNGFTRLMKRDRVVGGKPK